MLLILLGLFNKKYNCVWILWIQVRELCFQTNSLSLCKWNVWQWSELVHDCSLTSCIPLKHQPFLLQPESEVSTTAEDCSSEVRWHFLKRGLIFDSVPALHSAGHLFLNASVKSFTRGPQKFCEEPLVESHLMFCWPRYELTGKWLPWWDDRGANDVLRGLYLGTVIRLSSTFDCAFGSAGKLNAVIMTVCCLFPITH